MKYIKEAVIVTKKLAKEETQPTDVGAHLYLSSKMSSRTPRQFYNLLESNLEELLSCYDVTEIQRRQIKIKSQ